LCVAKIFIDNYHYNAKPNESVEYGAFCSKLYTKQESIDFPEQMRFVNLQRLLHGLRSVKITTSVSLRDEQVFTACVCTFWWHLCWTYWHIFAGLFVDYLCHECVKVIIFKIIARVTVTVLALSLLSVCGDRKTNSL